MASLPCYVIDPHRCSQGRTVTYLTAVIVYQLARCAQVRVAWRSMFASQALLRLLRLNDAFVTFSGNNMLNTCLFFVSHFDKIFKNYSWVQGLKWSRNTVVVNSSHVGWSASHCGVWHQQYYHLSHQPDPYFSDYSSRFLCLMIQSESQTGVTLPCWRWRRCSFTVGRGLMAGNVLPLVSKRVQVDIRATTGMREESTVLSRDLNYRTKLWRITSCVTV